MRSLACAVAATCLSTRAPACPTTDALVERYGISFSGFAVEILSAQAPDVAPGESLVRITIPDTSHVIDGFHDAVVLDTAKRKRGFYVSGSG